MTAFLIAWLVCSGFVGYLLGRVIYLDYKEGVITSEYSKKDMLWISLWVVFPITFFFWASYAFIKSIEDE